MEDKTEKAEKPLRATILTREELVNLAQDIASRARVSKKPSKGENIYDRFRENAQILHDAYYTLAEAAANKEILTAGAEWLLDNYHVVEEHVREIKKHLPRRYYRTLPKLTSGKLAGYPRVYQLAVEFISHSDSVVEGESLSSFIRSYQEVTTLTIGELWAVPIMLRLALIENLRRLAVANVSARRERLLAEELAAAVLKQEDCTASDLLLEFAHQFKERPAIGRRGTVYLLKRLRSHGRKALLTLGWLETRIREQGLNPDQLIREDQYAQAADQISIGNTVTSLKYINRFNWKTWFESVSKVHAILMRDPAGMYSTCDFETRDRYRHRLEHYARRSGLEETEVATKLIDFIPVYAKERLKDATESNTALKNRLLHIGYYLIDEGQREFEQFAGIKLDPREYLARYLKKHAFLLYITSIALLSLMLVFFAASIALKTGATPALMLALTLLLVFPASQLAIDVVQWIVTRMVKPDYLARLDYDYGIPESAKTAVAVHIIVKDKLALSEIIDALEVRYLGNEDPNLIYALLADLPDADSETLPADEDLMQFATNRIKELNDKYSAGSGTQPFYLLFRKRLWNEGEGKFMGYERKRGKIMEFNRLLLGDDNTSFELLVGNLSSLRACRFVITLDQDTQLPRGTARKLVATIAHPLNRAIIDSERNVVTSGYGIIQPRVGISLRSAHASLFSRIFCGHAGIDPYTQAVSDVYQDLFKEGSYIGKGIYDIAAFEKTLSERVPDNALLSHDLFESLFARCALATNIELLDDFPPRYNVYARRQHRWVRGDWQLLPWVGRKIPDKNRKYYRSPISALGRWKLIDNLRRSLLAPASFLALLVGWVFMPQAAWFWLLTILVVLAFPVYANLAGAFMITPIGLSLGTYARGVGRDLMRNSLQTLLILSFLPYQAYLMVHAVTVTLYRLYISKKHLLEWETAYYAEKRLGTGLLACTWQMLPGVILSLLSTGLLLSKQHPLPLSFMLVFPLWLCSPLIASYASKPRRKVSYSLRQRERERLREYAWSTWRYFNVHLTQEYNYLIPDNLQLVPTRRVAERTSPTNMGLSLLSIVSAYNLGFISMPVLLDKLAHSIASMKKLERYRGHFYNWYQIKTLAPLAPRYISTVDSGNLVGHLIALRQALINFEHEAVVTSDHFVHLRNGFSHFSKLVSEFDYRLAGKLKKLAASVPLQTTHFGEIINYLDTLAGDHQELSSPAEPSLALSGEIGERLLNFYAEIAALVDLKRFFSWHKELLELRRKLIDLDERDTNTEELQRELNRIERVVSGRTPTYALLIKITNRIISLTDKALKDNGFSTGDIKENLVALQKSASETLSALEEMVNKRAGLIEDISTIISSTDFTFLFDSERELFSIGYDVDNARLENSYYDLLASEARLASFVAIASGQVEQKHWFMLGRKLADSPGGKALMSWSATMFEYLMPLLVMHDYPETILSETYRAVVRAQIHYGKKRGVPWGFSESGYSGVDFEKTYQYKAFGVPGLGLKRGLSEDLVVSPYSTFLALPIDPRASLKNLLALEREGLRGEFGFFEAADYTAERLSRGERCNIVRSFLAHHQGMTLISLNNFLNDNVIQDCFHADPAVKATDLLLHERFPHMVPATVPHQAELTQLEREEEQQKAVRTELHTTAHTFVPRTRIISNGRYSLMIDNAGCGYSTLDNTIAVNRWREDAEQNQYGIFIFIKDLDSGKVWSVGYQPTCVEPDSYEVLFSPDKIEFKRKDFGIATRAEITVSPEDNVEVRRVTLTNLSPRRRNLAIVSYAEVVLGDKAGDKAHPAYAKMFVQSEFLPDYDALLFFRRPRSRHDSELYLFHMTTTNLVWERTRFETSRFNFIGRGRSVFNPQALSDSGRLSDTTGPVLDPVMALQTRIELDQGGSQSLTFTTGIESSRDEAVHLAARYRDLSYINRAFEMAWSQSNVELRHERFSISQTHTFQHLANAILFNVPQLRAEPEVIEKNYLTQSGFWRFGVSGDFPIVFARISDPSQIELVQELLLAHEYLRMRNFEFELIILNEYPGGYFQDFQEELENLIKHGYSAAMAEKRGGVFLRNTAQLSAEEIILIESTARIILQGANGPLEKQLKLDGETAPALRSRRSIFSVLGDESYRKYEPPARELLFENSYGGFSADGCEYIMTVSPLKRPPLPWSNIIANENFGTLVTESGSCYSWSENSRENRLTPWSNDFVSDPPGEVLYIRDLGSGAYWSATPAPVHSDDLYRTTHGFGYTKFETQIRDVFSELTLFTPLDSTVKLYKLKLTNGDYLPREIELVFYCDLVIGINRDDSYRTIVTDFDSETELVTAINRYNNEFAGRTVFVGSNLSLNGYTTDRTEFIGRNRTLSSPYALESAVASGLSNLLVSARQPTPLSKKTGAGFNPCAALSVTLTLDPGESDEVLFFLGEAHSLESAREIKRKFSSVPAAENSLMAVREFWDLKLRQIRIETPDSAFNIIMNGWLLYQTIACRLFARSAFYQSGGAYGFRDQLQDTLALLPVDPDMTRKQILKHAARQFVEGDVQHWWHPPTGRGVRTRISDDYLWLPYVVAAYLEATGDSSILEESVPFIEAAPLEEGQMETYIVPHVSEHRGSIYEHCIIALDRAINLTGPHNLPLIGGGDWNDGMNEVGVAGKGESIWLGWFIIDILKKFIPLVTERNDRYRADLYKTHAAKLLDAIEKDGWDGKWYRRAYFDDGRALGSCQNDECRIDSLAQSWGVLTDAADPARKREAMQHVYEYLVDDQHRLIKLLTPPFDKSDLEPGYIKGYLPGVRENGGQYTHAAAWVIMATARLGLGDLAFKLFQYVNPVTHTDCREAAEQYQGEPYVTCGDVYSVSPHEGRAGWSWYTGSAGWIYQAGLCEILGLKLSASHFSLKPCVPSGWKQYRISFTHKATRYEITVNNPEGLSCGKIKLEVDGQPLSAERLEFDSFADRTHVNVNVTILAAESLNSESGRPDQSRV
ncbi:MAG: hypothetical protein D6719_02280 [Candidatus Dadabacteria bacterium]|nr:MAG: hypothetical protein D6719_02280 [Candidatus Dadabacteria bacterium]